MKFRKAKQLFYKDFFVFLAGVLANIGCNLVWFLLILPFKSELVVFAGFIAIFSVSALFFQLITWLVDPGYLPKGVEPSGSIYMPPLVQQVDVESGSTSSSSAINHNIPVAKTYPFIRPETLPQVPEPFSAYSQQVIIKNVILYKKYCPTCSVWRPLRASHCSECDYCVERHDHHCPWMANYCVLVCGTTIYSTMNFASQYYGAFIALASFTGILSWPLAGLVGYHTYLVAKNVTTHEDIRSHRGDNEARNPFDAGSLGANCHDTLITPFRKYQQGVRTFEDS